MSSNSDFILKKFDLTNKTVIVTGASRGLGQRFSYVLSSWEQKWY